MLFQTLYNDNLPWIGSLATVEKPMTCCQGCSEVRWRIGARNNLDAVNLWSFGSKCAIEQVLVTLLGLFGPSAVIW